jgi:phage virion morphogenesis protein
MTGATIKVDDREVREALERLARTGGDLRSALAEIGESLLISHRDRFDRQQDPEGKPWAPLSDKYRARKRRNKDKILVLDSYLKDLLRYQIEAGGQVLRFGTDRIYGATHQFGDDKRNIPARPFLGISEGDRRMVVDVLNKYLARAMGK